MLDPVALREPAPKIGRFSPPDEDVPERSAADFVPRLPGEAAERLVEADDRAVGLEHAEER